MYQRQAVDEDGHVVARVVIARGLLVLVEHLQTVVVDVLFVQQVDVFGRTAVLPQHLHMIELNPSRLFQNPVVCARDAVFEKARPLAVRKNVVVQEFQLAAEVGDERGLVVNLQIFIPLRTQKPQKFLLQRRLALIAVRPAGIRRVLGYDRTLGGGGDDVELAHSNQKRLKANLGTTGIFNICDSSVRCADSSIVEVATAVKVNFNQSFSIQFVNKGFILRLAHAGFVKIKIETALHRVKINAPCYLFLCAEQRF